MQASAVNRQYGRFQLLSAGSLKALTIVSAGQQGCSPVHGIKIKFFSDLIAVIPLKEIRFACIADFIDILLSDAADAKIPFATNGIFSVGMPKSAVKLALCPYA